MPVAAATRGLIGIGEDDRRHNMLIDEIGIGSWGRGCLVTRPDADRRQPPDDVGVLADHEVTSLFTRLSRGKPIRFGGRRAIGSD